ncbi:hypothetical protein BHE74_00014418 [Ensete ventricosum]|nr:hypothetical protein BHE74_00014418 [Ensete ventricosum]
MLTTHTAAWVAEFVLRQPVEDWLANEIFLALPLPSPLPFRLRHTILLHRLASDLSRCSPSLNTLHSLDLLLDDRPASSSSSSSSSSESMAVAYRAVALHCVSLSFSASNYDVFRTFVDLLRSRVADLERAGPAVLAAEPLKKLRMEIEAAVESGIFRGLLERNTSNEALDAIRVYLKAAMEELGPPFLVLAAEAVRNGIELGNPCSESSAKSDDKVKVSGVAGGVGERTSTLSLAVSGEVVLLETNPVTSSTLCDTCRFPLTMLWLKIL